MGAYGNSKDTPICIKTSHRTILSHVNRDANYMLHKAHDPKNVRNAKRLILILRNPKECVVRHTGSFNEGDIEKYMDLIIFFEKFKGDKLLLYYEDLLSNPKIEVEKLLDFLNIKKTKIKRFSKKYDYIFNESIKVYNNRNNRPNSKSKTSGLSLIHHSKSLRKEDLELYDSLINLSFSRYKSYVERYN